MGIMTPYEKQNLIDSLEQAIEAAKDIPTTTPCRDCVFWQDGFCKKWETQIPPETLPLGCEEFTFDRFSPPF